jgi:hypothetical protein
LLLAISAVGCSPATSTSQPVPPDGISTASTLDNVATTLATDDLRPALAAVYLPALQRLKAHCKQISPTSLLLTVSRFGNALQRANLAASPDWAAEVTLANDVHGKENCAALASAYALELDAKPARTADGWGGYAGTFAAWGTAHRPDPARPGFYRPRLADGQDAYELVGYGQVLTMYRYFSPPVSATIALASIRRALLPGAVRVGYALTARECQQAIYLGHTLGTLLGSRTLGAFVELSSGRGVGRTRYDADLVDRARITPLGRIGGEPCT